MAVSKNVRTFAARNQKQSIRPMDNFTIHCTEEQTKKALELGAPIEALYSKADYLQRIPTVSIKGEYVTYDYFIPTAEEMIGWLEEQDNIKSVEVTQSFGWHYRVKRKSNDAENWIRGDCRNRKEATLAAIDAALEYLTNNKIKL